MAKQRILFLYIMAGNGHYMAAQALSEEIKSQYGEDAEVVLANGFAPEQKFSHVCFEGGYHVAANYLPWIWKFICFINRLRPLRDFERRFIERSTTRYIMRLIKEHDITHVVCTNYVICSNARNAIREGNFNIPLTIIVTDPFDAHQVWFDVSDAHFILFSPVLQRQAREKYHVKDSAVFPYIIRRQFAFTGAAGTGAGETGRKNKEFMVLIAGGGEGLPGMVPLVHYMLFSLTKEKDINIKLVVVCGRDKSAYEILKKYALLFHRVKIDIHGYADNIPELLCEAGCLVTKAGPAMLLEAIVCDTPVIVSMYLPQEESNIEFLEKNNVGWYIKKPKRIYDQIRRLATDDAYYAEVRANIRSLGIKADNSALARHLYELPFDKERNSHEE